MTWLNAQHVKALSPEKAHELFLKFYPDTVIKGFDAKKLSGYIQGKVEKLGDLPAMTSFLTGFDENYSTELFVNKKNKTTLESCKETLTDLHGLLSGVDAWEFNPLLNGVMGYSAQKPLKLGAVMWPLRIALSGMTVTPTGAIEIAELLGRDEALRRIALAINRL